MARGGETAKQGRAGAGPCHRRGLRRLGSLVRAFHRDEQGAVAVVLSIMVTVIVFFAALAIDNSRFTSEWMQDRQALDAAILAASDAIGEDDQEALAKERGKAFYLANRPDGKAEDIVDIKLDPDTGIVSGDTRFDWKATLLRALGFEKVKLGGHATAVRGGTAEVALVLDNSGSMSGTYIEDLKTAAENLVNTVFTGAESDGQMSVSVVPFAGSVNVGSGNRGAAWMDNDGVSPLDRENTMDARSRFQLFDDLAEAWSGCVEVRKAPYDANDSAPDSETPATLFTPMFAPDEPDDLNSGGDSYSNNYLVDDGGTCPKQECTCPQKTSGGKCKSTPGWVLSPLDTATAQARTCKYSGETVGYASPSGDKCRRGSLDGNGPNAYCTTRPLLPLSTRRDDVTSAIRAMIASGNTNIPEGVAWGWRTLSPGTPFTEGRNYDDKDNKKIMIVMTDGENTYTSSSNHNKSRYGALGYAKPYVGGTGRLGATYSSSAYVTTMNNRLTTVCANAKAEGIKIYTVAFRLESNPTTQALLKACASETGDYFAASDGATLIETFQNIGREISKLRIAS